MIGTMYPNNIVARHMIVSDCMYGLVLRQNDYHATTCVQNSDMFWKPTVAIQGDVADAIQRISKDLRRSLKVDPDWIKTLHDRDVEKEKQNK